jgi:predicted O-methyltransferase YrrM
VAPLRSPHPPRERARFHGRRLVLPPLERARAALGRRALAAAGRLNRVTYLPLEYPYAATPRPRWGHGRPAHARLEALLAAHESSYAQAIAGIASQRADLLAITPDFRAHDEPYWRNSWLPALDAAALYAFVRARAPQRYVEVGSGVSTAFAARARADGATGTRIVSIDPRPRAEVADLCDEVVPAALQDADLGVFAELVAGDVVFVDGSHQVLMNSDAVTFVLDLLPELAAGVLVGVHDVYLPDDYPPQWSARHYGEQYLLAAYLLGGGVVPVLPAHYLAGRDDLLGPLDALWGDSRLAGVEGWGNAFWLEAGGDR